MARLLSMTEAEFARAAAMLDGPLLTPTQFNRAGLMIRIYRALHDLFVGDMADRWPDMPNRAVPYDGRSPIAFMANGGTDAMIHVLMHIRAIAQGL